MIDENPPRPDGPELPSEIDREEGRLMNAIHRHVSNADPTGVLSESLSAAIPDLFLLPFEARKGSAGVYRLIPLHTDTGSLSPKSFVWRVELHGIRGSDPLGFDIVGDVVIGRGSGEGGVDIDLEPFDALQNGVSRRHAMLRPTQRSLYVLDLASTNGTQHNAIPLSSGSTRRLQDGDMLSLGRLSFTVMVIARPPLPGETPEPADPPTNTGPLADSDSQPDTRPGPNATPGILPAVPPDGSDE